MASARRGTRFIFVTGGVVSSLGKGIAAASIGQLLVARGLSVSLQKFDPYINVDPGTMSPFQHGEVFVTEDGAETDLDLGHYERFTDVNTTRSSNVTTGAVLGHEDLAVLERAHRARVDVDVRVELLQRDRQAPGDQQLADRGGGDALAERRDDAACHEDEPSTSHATTLARAQDEAHAASNSFAWRLAPASEASAPSIRQSSSTTAESSNRSTRVSATSSPGDFSIRK